MKHLQAGGDLFVAEVSGGRKIVGKEDWEKNRVSSFLCTVIYCSCKYYCMIMGYYGTLRILISQALYDGIEGFCRCLGKPSINRQ